MTAPDELRQLADRLDVTARYMYPHEDIVDGITAADMRAAAVALRHHATLIDAIGDLSGGWTVLGGERILDRIAAAVSPPPAPSPVSDPLDDPKNGLPLVMRFG